jgi:hypothetical protein
VQYLHDWPAVRSAYVDDDACTFKLLRLVLLPLRCIAQSYLAGLVTGAAGASLLIASGIGKQALLVHCTLTEKLVRFNHVALTISWPKPLQHSRLTNWCQCNNRWCATRAQITV